MLEIFKDTIKDSVSLIPFLFFAFLIIEIIEHKLNTQTKKIVSKSGSVGPLFGGILGIFPQCGFSVMATNLYITRIISLGTLISIYLTTSDEMLPIMLSKKIDFNIILNIILIKLAVGIICGFIIDYIFRNKNKKTINHDICESDHCHCNKGKNIFSSALKHMFITLGYIAIISLILNSLLSFIGEDNLAKVFMKDSLFGPFASSLVGLIPNCSSSIIITELYLKSSISIGSLIAGLLTGSGVSLLVLFKSNKNLKENFMILGIVYSIGVISGIIIELIGMLNG